MDRDQIEFGSAIGRFQDGPYKPITSMRVLKQKYGARGRPRLKAVHSTLQSALGEPIYLPASIAFVLLVEGGF